jgi:glutamate synthase (NADPH/NADH) large chain
MPRDYRRAVDAQRMAEANGTDVDRALMEAAARG